MNDRKHFGRQKHFIKLRTKYLITKIPEDPSIVVLRRKALETFHPSPRSKSPQLYKHKNNTPIIFSKNAQNL